MAIKTYTQQLEEVQTAISAIISGAQSYQFNGRMFTKASLSTLQDREEWLIKQVQKHEPENLPNQKPAFSVSRIVPES